MTKLKPTDRTRLALLWTELRDAESSFTIAGHVVDDTRFVAESENSLEINSTLETGVDIVGGGEGMDAVTSANAAMERAVTKWSNAQANLRTAYVAILGDDADELINQLLAAIENCYETGARHFRTQITGTRGAEALANVQAAMDLINDLVDGDPVMVGTVPAARA